MEHLASPRSSLSASQKQVAERDGAGEDGEDPAVVVVALPGRPGEPLPALCA